MEEPNLTEIIPADSMVPSSEDSTDLMCNPDVDTDTQSVSLNSLQQIPTSQNNSTTSVIKRKSPDQNGTNQQKRSHHGPAEDESYEGSENEAGPLPVVSAIEGMQLAIDSLQSMCDSAPDSKLPVVEFIQSRINSLRSSYGYCAPEEIRNLLGREAGIAFSPIPLRTTRAWPR